MEVQTGPVGAILLLLLQLLCGSYSFERPRDKNKWEFFMIKEKTDFGAMVCNITGCQLFRKS